MRKKLAVGKTIYEEMNGRATADEIVSEARSGKRKR